MTTGKSLAALFRRDLSRLMQQLAGFPDGEAVWATPPGVTNSAGNLALHIEGNLREYIGRQLGGLPYDRNRPLEFTLTGLRRAELVSRIGEVSSAIPAIVESLSQDRLEAEYPEVVLDAPMSVQEFLMHLYGHLNWHRGQIDYLRRILASP